MALAPLIARDVAGREPDRRRRGGRAAMTAVAARASPALAAPVAREPGSLDATLARCVARRAPALDAPPGVLQRSCLKATQRDSLLYLDEPDKQEVERQALEDGAAVQWLLMRGGLMIALARPTSTPTHVTRGFVDVEDEPPPRRRGHGGGKMRRTGHAYRFDPYGGAEHRPYRSGGVHTRYPRSPLMVSTKAVAAGSVNAATANATLTVTGATHTVKAWNTGAHGAKTPDQIYATKYALGPHGTASQAKLVRSYTRQGSGVGATRPNGWTDFCALLGMTQSGQIAGKMRWVQGHFINEHLGGRGEQQNLAPFTRSLNTRHYHAVEKHVIAAIAGGQTVDYSVKAIAGTPGSQNETDAIAWHRAARANYPQSMINAMVAVGALNAADALTLTAGAANPGTTPTPNSGALTLAGVEAAVEAWITSYVQAAFPTAIACRVRYYSPLPPLPPPPTPPPPPLTTAKGQPAAHSAKSVGEVVIENRR